MATTALPRPFSVQTTVTANNQFTRGSQVINGDLTVTGGTGSVPSQISTAAPTRLVGTPPIADNTNVVLTAATHPSGSVVSVLHDGGAGVTSVALPAISTVGVGYNLTFIWHSAAAGANAIQFNTNAADSYSANSFALMGGVRDNHVNSIAALTGVDNRLAIVTTATDSSWGVGSHLYVQAIGPVATPSWLVRGRGGVEGTGDDVGNCVFSSV